MIYKMNFTDGKMEPISNEGKNDLPIGAVLQLNGYDCPRFVITKNMGASKTFEGYGSRYLTVHLESYDQRQHQAHELEFLRDKTNNRIQTYITDEVLPRKEVDRIVKLSNEKYTKDEKTKDEAARIHQEKLAKGKEIIDAKKPTWAKSVIVACEEIDDCDLQSDYFNTKTGKTYILAWSKHNKDLFPEMRKAAKLSKLSEVQHLITPATVDGNGNPKTETNKSWWHPADEHREKYSMGAGYYLKAARRYSTGWKIEKRHLAGWTIEELYVAAAEGRYLVSEN